MPDFFLLAQNDCVCSDNFKGVCLTSDRLFIKGTLKKMLHKKKLLLYLCYGI